MNNMIKFSYSQIRYIIRIYRLSLNGCGVKNTELAEGLKFSKPSVHNMLKSLAELGVVKQKTFGLAHLTEDGMALAKKYEAVYSLLEKKMKDLCGDGATSENAICGVIADMPQVKLDELYESVKNEK